MALSTEALIKRTLTRLFKLVIRWYEEHPEGRRDPKQEIDCYGTATFGLRIAKGEEEIHKIATITLQSDETTRYIDIRPSIHGQYVKG